MFKNGFVCERGLPKIARNLKKPKNGNLGLENVGLGGPPTVVPKPGFPKPSFPLFRLLGFFQCFRSMLLLAPNKDSPTKLQSERKPQPAPVAFGLWPNSIWKNDGTKTKNKKKEHKTENTEQNSENTEI